MGGKAGAWALVLCGLVLGAGCSGGNKNPPHLKDNPTFGAECTSVWQVLCKRAVTDCQVYMYGTTEKDCNDTFVPACCGNICDSIADSTQADVDKCNAALKVYSCDALAQQQLPTECKGVIY